VWKEGVLLLPEGTRALFPQLDIYASPAHYEIGTKLHSPLSPNKKDSMQELIPQIDEFDDVNLPDDEQSLLARIPLMAGSSKKAAYLAFRATGFTVGKSCDLAGTTRQSIQNWRNSDPVFRMWEQEKLQELQSSVGNDVIKFDFLRNMKLLLHQDMTIISKAMLGMDELDSREYEVYKNIRKFYTPAEWLALEKVLAPEKHRDTGPIKIVLNWGNRLPDNMQLEGESRELLDEPAIDTSFATVTDSDL